MDAAAVGTSSPAGRLIARGADEPRDREVLRVVEDLDGVPICTTRPSIITAMRSAMVMASVWSWVT